MSGPATKLMTAKEFRHDAECAMIFGNFKQLVWDGE
jgi:hypothetical protein